MIRVKKLTAFILLASAFTGMAACGKGGDTEYEPELTETSMILQGDYKAMVDPPLLKKIAMYNAGCIDPLSNYERDFEKIDLLKSNSLRIDLSIGKKNGTAGEELVAGTLEDYTFDFSRLDSIVDIIGARHVLPYLSWGYIPVPLQGENGFTDLDTSIAGWQEIWEDIYYNYSKHYADKGVKIGYHEIYNEPDLEYLKEWGIFNEDFVGFLDLDDFKSAYLDMYKYGAKGILKGDPDATIGGPAYAMGEIAGWTGFMNSVAANRLPLDFFSFHTYLDGDTWPSEKETVVGLLANNRYFNKTSLHINEFSWLNDANGLNEGLLSPSNFAEGATKTLSAALIALEDTDITMIHWAQFMDPTFNHTAYGLIGEEGHKRASYHAMSMLADMPVWRYDVKTNVADNGLEYVTSADEEKISFLVWNNTEEDKTFTYQVKNAPFSSGELTMYRVDENHASYYDDAEEELQVSLKKKVNGLDRTATGYRGKVPADGIVYITINKSQNRDFTAGYRDFANDIKTQYYFGDRYDLIRGSYSFFDRNEWAVYMGMGNNASSVQSAAITLEDLPEEFGIKLLTEGTLSDASSARLGFRIDYHTSEGYTKSTFFHNGVYTNDHDYLWVDWNEFELLPAEKKFEGETARIKLSEYAPSGFDGRVMMSFYMSDTGADTRSRFIFEE